MFVYGLLEIKRKQTKVQLMDELGVVIVTPAYQIMSPKVQLMDELGVVIVTPAYQIMSPHKSSTCTFFFILGQF